VVLAPDKSAPPLAFETIPMIPGIVVDEARHFTLPFQDGIEGLVNGEVGKFWSSVTSCDMVKDCPAESDAETVTKYVLGEPNEWLAGLPDWLDPSPKFQEYKNGGVPPVGIAVKTVVSGVTAVV
jgi:hypothetical protein